MRMRKSAAVAAIILHLFSALDGAGAEDRGQVEPPRIAWMKSISGSAEESVPRRRSRGDGTRDLPRIARGVSTDRHQGVFISGSFLGECTLDGQRLSSAGAADVFVGRLDADGKVRWFKRFGAGGTDISPDVATDSLGNCVVTGMCSDGAAFDKATVRTVGGSDAFTAKLDPDGRVLWVRTVGGPRPDCGNEVCTDSDDNILVVGNSYGPVRTEKKEWSHAGGMDSLVLKYSPDGDLLWAESITGSADEQGRGIATDAQGNVLVVGEFAATVRIGHESLTATGNARDVFAAKLSPAGKVLWTRRFGAAGEDYARGVGCDGAGNAYVTGVFSGEVAFGSEHLRAGGAENLFLMKLSPRGEVVWAGGITGPGLGHGCEIEVTSDGHAILSGDVMGELTIGSTTIRSTGRRDTFVACFDREGHLDWVKPIRAQATAANFAVALDPSGRITVVGSYAGTLECDGRRLAPNTRMESFIITLDKMPSRPEPTSK